MNDDSLDASATRSCGKRPRTPTTDAVSDDAAATASASHHDISNHRSLRLVRSADDAVLGSSQVDEEPLAKVPCRRRTSSPCTLLTAAAEAFHHDPPQPTRIAPRWADYIAPGGIRRYLPRPEWCRPFINNTTTETTSNSGPQIETAVTEGGMQRLEQQAQEPLAPDANVARAHAAQEAPADGLLPEDAFVEFMSRQMNHLDSSMAEQYAQAASSESPAVVEAVKSNVEDHQMALQGTGEDTADNPDGKSQERPMPQLPQRPCTFGKLSDTALLLAIRENATEVALHLLQYGAPVEACNAKGVTPLILAAQLGNLAVVQELLRRSAHTWTASANGTTALLQASHFGHQQIVQALLDHGAPVEKSNLHKTNSLMRAAQEGHYEVCRLLVKRGAKVNRQNRDSLSPLMLASQRGHARICQLLLDHGADSDCKTPQDSTSLLLACKRGHVDVVRVLVQSGCELFVKDSRDRTAQQMVARQLQSSRNRRNRPSQPASPAALRQNLQEIATLVDPVMQVHLMRLATRRERHHKMIQLWTLIQQERAKVPLEEDEESTPVDAALQLLDRNEFPAYMPPSMAALLRAMSLPHPLLQLVSEYLPLPFLWNRRIGLLTKRSSVDATATVACALDLIDEILHEGGFAAACGTAGVTPPTHYESWDDWLVHLRRAPIAVTVSTTDDDLATVNLATTSQRILTPSENPSAVEMRRQVGFLQLLANRSTLLSKVLMDRPYNMPLSLVNKLITVSDIQSIVRRLGSRGVQFQLFVATDLVMLASSLAMWYYRERDSR